MGRVGAAGNVIDEERFVRGDSFSSFRGLMASPAISVVRLHPGFPTQGWIGVVLRNKLGGHWSVSPPTNP